MKEKMLRNWARFAAAHPWWIIGVLLALTAVSVVSATRLRLDMRWSDMLPENDPAAEEFDRILKEYKTASNTIIVVRGAEEEIKRFAEAVAPEIEEMTDLVQRVDYKFDAQFFSEHGFMLADAEDLKETVSMFGDLNLVPFMRALNDNFEREYIGDEEALSTKQKEAEAVRALEGLEFWLETVRTFVDGGLEADSALADSAVDRFLIGDPYTVSQDKDLLLMVVKPTFTSIDVGSCVESTRLIRAIVADAQQQFPNVQASLTGAIAVQADENSYVMRDMSLGFVLAMVLVFTLFVLTFRMWSTPILAALNLLIAILITVGAVTLYPGRLNPMTAMFGVILIGLGIDYSIHIISIYSERRKTDSDVATAMAETLVRSGSGIITGALTTAVAFFALAVSSSRGIKEMGIVLGMGILSAMVTTVAGLPAFLVVRERVLGRIKGKPVRLRDVEFRALGRLGETITRKPGLFLAIGIILTAFFIYQSSRAKFDSNMFNLEPEGMVSVALYDTIIEAFDLSPDFAMVMASSIEESWELAERARETPVISAVDDIGEYCPPLELQRERKPYVEEIRRVVGESPIRRPLGTERVEDLVAELERLDMNIYELSQLAFIGGQDRVDRKARDLIGDVEGDSDNGMILDVARKIERDPAGAARRLSLFVDHYWQTMRARVDEMANPELITLDMLPDHIRNRYVSEDGTKFLVTMFPSEQVWNFESLRRFSDQVERISPKVTGTPALTLRLLRYIGRDGIKATFLTVAVVLLLLWLDFRSIRFALLGMIPLIAGGIWMTGLLQSFGMMFTVLNVTAIPMIVGIGIDDAVHVLHRYRVEGLDKTPVVLKSTGKAILLTSLTTMAGFGSLMTARYAGFVGLGAVLVMGVGSCFVTTVLFIPAVIGLTFRRGQA